MRVLGHIFPSSRLWLFASAAVMLGGVSCAARSEQALELDPKRVALVSFVNACSSDLEEHWQASVDVFFRGVPLCRDLRIGESSLLREVVSDEKGFVEIKRSGTDQVLARVSTSIRPETFLTVVITGRISSDSSSVDAMVLLDHPLPENQQSIDSARLVILSGILDYPTEVTIGGQKFANLQPGIVHEVFVQPGDKEIKMFFKDKRIGPSVFNTSSGLLAEQGSSYYVIFVDSPRSPGRPQVLVTDATRMRNDYLNALSAKEDGGLTE